MMFGWNEDDMAVLEQSKKSNIKPNWFLIALPFVPILVGAAFFVALFVARAPS